MTCFVKRDVYVSKIINVTTEILLTWDIEDFIFKPDNINRTLLNHTLEIPTGLLDPFKIHVIW